MSYSRLSERRKAVSTVVLAGVVVVVIAVAAVGAYFALGPSSQAVSSTTGLTSSSSGTHPTSSTTPTSSSSSTTTSSASTSTTTSTSSTTPTSSSSPSSTASSTSSAFSFDFALGNTPDTILVSVGSTVTYPSLILQPLPAASSGSETVTLNSTVPSGLTLTLSSNSVKLTTDAKASVGMTITSSQNVKLGNYPITVGAKYGTSSKTYDLTVKVVQYLVVLQSNNFSPSTLTVIQGSTVFWMNLDSPVGGDPEIHNVVFSSGPTAHSSDMATYNTYSYTFTDLGTYSYFCVYHTGMKGTITVVESYN